MALLEHYRKHLERLTGPSSRAALGSEVVGEQRQRSPEDPESSAMKKTTKSRSWLLFKALLWMVAGLAILRSTCALVW